MVNQQIQIPMQVRIDVPEEEQVKEGATFALMTIVYGAAIPLAGPDNQPIVMPVGSFAFPVDQATAEKVGKDLLEAAGKLPKPTRLVQASSLSGVEKAADFERSLRTN